MTTITMPVLYEKLQKLGFSQDYVRKQGLPTWWDDECDQDNDVALEGAAHISRRLRLDLLSLLEAERTPEFKVAPHTKFKYHAQNKADIPDAAHQIASSVAATIAHATELEFKPIPPNAQQVRAEILENHSQINLNSILDYCWSHGIAVVYFNNYPSNTRKITGLIQWHREQPVIVLSHSRKHPTWLAFHLAHELGHLAFSHVKKEDDFMLIDDEISHDPNDDEEMISNLFAVQLLLKHYDQAITRKRVYNGKQLSNNIQRLIDKEPSIDPCALAFNYAWHTGNFGFANKAIDCINNATNGDIVINHFLENHIDWDDLSDDVGDRLEQILGE